MAVDFNNSIGCWIHDPNTAIGKLHELQAVGFDYALVKTSDGIHAYHPDETRQLAKDAATIDLPLAAWHYARPSDVREQAATIAANLPDGVTDLVLDAEVEWEDYAEAHGTTSANVTVNQLCGAIKAATNGKVTLHLSSFWSPRLHSSFPFAAFMSHCKSWQPQAYLEPGSTRTAAQIITATMLEGAKLINPKQGQSVVVTVNNTSELAILGSHSANGWNAYVWDPDGDAAVISNKVKWTDAIKSFRGC